MFAPLGPDSNYQEPGVAINNTPFFRGKPRYPREARQVKVITFLILGQYLLRLKRKEKEVNNNIFHSFTLHLNENVFFIFKALLYIIQ